MLAAVHSCSVYSPHETYMRLFLYWNITSDFVFRTSSCDGYVTWDEPPSQLQQKPWTGFSKRPQSSTAGWMATARPSLLGTRRTSGGRLRRWSRQARTAAGPPARRRRRTSERWRPGRVKTRRTRRRRGRRFLPEAGKGNRGKNRRTVKIRIAVTARTMAHHQATQVKTQKEGGEKNMRKQNSWAITFLLSKNGRSFPNVFAVTIGAASSWQRRQRGFWDQRGVQGLWGQGVWLPLRSTRLWRLQGNSLTVSAGNIAGLQISITMFSLCVCVCRKL